MFHLNPITYLEDFMGMIYRLCYGNGQKYGNILWEYTMYGILLESWGFLAFFDLLFKWLLDVHVDGYFMFV